VPDAIFAEPRLAEIYDPLDPVEEVRDAPDRPGREFVFIARRGVRLKY